MPGPLQTLGNTFIGAILNSVLRLMENLVACSKVTLQSAD